MLNVVKPRGRADGRARALLARHDEVAEALGAALASLGAAAPPAFLEDSPPCTTEGLPPETRGVLEHNVRYDLEHGQGSQAFEEYDRARTERGMRAKRPDCGRCRYDDACPGPWKRYVDIHGWDELEPVP